MRADASIYTSMEGLTALKARASGDAKGSLDEVARQFESLFVQQMLKSMRQAGLGEGLMDSDQSLFYRDMYDQQLSVHLAESGGMGLAEVIKRQLGGTAGAGGDEGSGSDTDSDIGLPVKSIEDYRRLAMAVKLYSAMEAGSGAADRAGLARLDGIDLAGGADGTPRTDAGDRAGRARLDTTKQPDPRHWSPEEFVENLWPWASEAAGLIGLKPQALLAQAALETGWGKKLIRTADGAPANNLFGIKADRGWDGDRVSVGSLEYEQGTAVKRRAYFRAYESLRDSFHDYVDFLQSNPRYSDALGATEDSATYFTELQRAGYATDPEYANKINAVLNGSEMTRALERLKPEASRPL
ncbi:flagellar assembly peptidoglycan hydrolase FlgJ [Sedimenticola hydrogenitrophicus]|uniref:flagellar assembly peptidoglycan hydrolase FlgJ n=1 Tax=Sedimenticola hydrogenitrophicus TaxID=2967975 RepID=UPI0023AF783A|nr:flagellar assembly peptidoglycan hydrolase FlgJ [Sedimenticola hydrogenitrophicus]